jgi:hypothetical protein
MKRFEIHFLSRKLFTAIALLFLLTASATAQVSAVTQIKIVSAWGGLGKPEHDELIITRKGDSYYASGKKVDTRLVDRLINALNMPVIPEIDFANLGINQQWLDATAEKGVKEYADFYYSTAAPNLQALYLSTFKDIGFMKRLLPFLYPGMWTDDYPYVDVEVTEGSGNKVVASSEAQQLFMLPWEVTSGGRKVKTFNAEIARALVVLLPKKFANRERLSGEGMSRVLAGAVMRDIKDQWELLDAENQAGKYLQALKETYSVESAEIDSTHNVDFGKEWVKGDSGVKNLQAVLKRKDLPENFQIGIVLPFNNGEVRGVDSFLGGVDHYLNLALSVQWLKEFMHSEPNFSFELRFVGDRSFSEKAMQIFAADMRLKGKESLVKEVEAVQKDVSLLAVGWKYNKDYWLVLPDKRMVLWRFSMYRPPLKWKELNSSAWDCSRYQDKCVGAIISTDGTLLR